MSTDNTTLLAQIGSNTPYLLSSGVRFVYNTATAVSGTGPTSLQFQGFGSHFSFTPTKTGNVVLSMHGWGNTSAAGITRYTNLYIGTGTAPSWQTPVSSQTAVLGGNMQDIGVGTNVALALNLTSCVVYGLTVGTAYWCDLAAAVSTGAVDFTILQMSAHEI